MGSIDSKQQQPIRDDGRLRTMIHGYNDHLQRALIGCGQARKTFTTLSELWHTARLDSVQTMAEVADRLDQHHRTVNMANLGGAASCAAGGTAGVASILLAPVTGGMSAALAVGGILGTVAGSATVLAANMTEVYLTKELMEKVQRVLEADSLYTKALKSAFKEVIIHENELTKVLCSIQTESRILEADHSMTSSTSSSSYTNQKVPSHAFIISSSSVDHLMNLVTCFFHNDEDFLRQLQKTKQLIEETPTMSGTLPSSSDFFQALKEISSITPAEETLRRIGETAVTSIGAQAAASIGTQIVALGLGAVFVALDVYHLVKTSRNFDEGSKTELSRKIRLAVMDLKKELEQICHLNKLFQQVTF